MMNHTFMRGPNPRDLVHPWDFHSAFPNYT
jgi:hypothetical protein